MHKKNLTDAVQELAHLMENQTDEVLDTPWSWGSYSSEGVRFAFFRTYEELVELTTQIKAERTNQWTVISSAQGILAGYRAAYRDLQAVLTGVSQEYLDQPPGKDEWPVRQVLAHIIGADIGFYGVMKYALERHRLQDKRPAEMSEADWDRTTGLTEDAYKSLMSATVPKLTDYHTNLHHQIITEFSGIQENELQKTATYWEETPMTIQFRLQRFESHMRQHTIQIEKTLAAIIGTPTEINRLLRMLFAGLAAVESAWFGAPEAGSLPLEAAAQVILNRTAELKKLLN
jgi:uncharacterized damage-inducible protein DinB